jgi:hypothetical protein
MKILLVIDDTLGRRVDEVRGKQPRVSWIRDAIEDKLGIAGKTLLGETMVPHETAPRLAKPLAPAPPEALRGVREPDPGPPVPPTDEYQRIKAQLPTFRPSSGKRHYPNCACGVCKPVKS